MSLRYRDRKHVLLPKRRKAIYVCILLYVLLLCFCFNSPTSWNMPDGTFTKIRCFFFHLVMSPTFGKGSFFPSDWSNWRELLSATFKAGQPDFIQALQFRCSPHSVSARKKVGDRLGKSLRLLNVFEFLQFT